MKATCKHCGRTIHPVKFAWGPVWMHEQANESGTHQMCADLFPRSVAVPVDGWEQP